MALFLRQNSPWRELVSWGHVELRILAADQPVTLAPDLTVIPRQVPHRGELSETVAFEVHGHERRALFLPDIDDFKGWDPGLETRVCDLDRAWIDGTFFSGAELPGRDLEEIPHPFMDETLRLMEGWTPAQRSKIYFTHLNHSNPVCDPNSAERRRLEASGAQLALLGDRFAL
jgi:pyrroloquinoline quinone biosynthesis protein B